MVPLAFCSKFGKTRKSDEKLNNSIKEAVFYATKQGFAHQHGAIIRFSIQPRRASRYATKYRELRPYSKARDKIDRFFR
jgi:hypothetical protein